MVEGVEAEFAAVAVGAGQYPLAVHPAVGDHGRAFQHVVRKQVHFSPRMAA
jgi:hypothetical protein